VRLFNHSVTAYSVTDRDLAAHPDTALVQQPTPLSPPNPQWHHYRNGWEGRRAVSQEMATSAILHRNNSWPGILITSILASPTPLAFCASRSSAACEL